MSDITLTTSSIVAPSSSPPVVIYQYTNPEIILPPLILEYLTKVGFNSMFPNFQGVRVGAEHPFWTFEYNALNGAAYDLNILPSITIKDAQDTETFDTLGMNYQPVSINSTFVAELVPQLFDASDNSGFLVTSSANISTLQAATQSGATINGLKRMWTARHTIQFEIWADNKNITSLLYNAMDSFVLDSLEALHALSIDFQDISGSRSGDVNLDYGRVLWGASLVFNAFIRSGVMEIDVNLEDIEHIDVTPTFSEAM